jgi:hypothetical protein
MTSDNEDRIQQPDEPEESGQGYDIAPLAPEDRAEELAKKVHGYKRGKRSRSIHKADEVPTNPLLIRQGWLDGVFAGPNLLILLAVTFFFAPIMFPVAVFALITASDADARRNAVTVMAFCLAPVLLLACLYCLATAIHPR